MAFPFGQKKSAMTIVKMKTWFGPGGPLCESISGRTRNPKYVHSTNND